MLTAEDRRVFENWLQAKGVSKECPSCGAADYDLPGVYNLPMMKGPQIVKIGDITLGMATVAMLCKNCNQVRLFCAGPMALPSISAILPPLG